MAKASPKKTVTKKTSPMKVIKKLRTLPEDPTFDIQEVKRSPFGFISKLFLIVILGSVLFLLAQKYRGFFIAGTVNSIPVTRYEVNKKMTEKYGKQTFDEIVSERLLTQELKKNNITVSSAEVDAEMAKIVKDYGNEEAFKAALTQYGLTEVKAKESIKQSLSLKKMIEKTYKIEISTEAIKKYFDENKKLFEGKKLEEVTANIKDTLYQQEVYAKTQEWFAGIRKSAKVVSFI